MSTQYARGSEWRRWDLHVHTASSYDANYKGEDADALLCAALTENNIAAVAITDHFLIDHERIGRLRTLAPNITFFPGVELRSDKGTTNLHLTLIFSEEMDVQALSNEFNVIMLGEKALSKDSNDTIHWNFDDIISFARDRKGLVAVHAGRKTGGVDKEISNALPANIATKEDIARDVDFFEVGKPEDINDYYEHVFKSVDEKPIILCSDCHNPKSYSTKENLWIKANPTFEGLLQCVYQPKERVFVGAIPPALDRAQKNGRSNISSISAERIADPKNTIYNWLSFDLELNSGLVTIIGNKGSGKSALSDILGHLCKCTTMPHASFLHTDRFRKLPKNYANDYEATIVWGDSHKETLPLSTCNYGTTIGNAQYLPQKYIEEICNDIDNAFQHEIDKAIFSYIDKTERGAAIDLSELVQNKSKSIELTIQKICNELDSINEELVRLEDRKTKQHRTYIEDSYKKLQETLERHERSKPAEVKKPAVKEADKDYQEKLGNLEKEITDLESLISETRDALTIANERIDDTSQVIARIGFLEESTRETNIELQRFIEKHALKEIGEIAISSPKQALEKYLETLIEAKAKAQALLHGKTADGTENLGLIAKLESANAKKDELVSTADGEEKAFQKYLSDYKEWEDEKKKIEGDSTTEGTIAYFYAESLYLNEQLESDYGVSRKKRNEKIRELFDAKQQLVDVYKKIYTPIESEISKLLGSLEENIAFEAEIQLVYNDLGNTLLGYINKRIGGTFKGQAEAQNKMSQWIRETEFNKADSILMFINKVMQVIDEDIDASSKKVSDRKQFYEQLCSLDYVGVAFKLKVGDRNLEELSPGERGIVLLIFYLALSKDSTPIIIDQPEDNLDNQSVYSKLVPCICEAKKKRQVIIVTHNPNIAIACDAEQIIFCNIDKSSNAIGYQTGAIEEQRIRECVVDVLEGTMPAFDLRKRKYLERE